ncbi:MAG: tetratricopeptide repeat protein [bacterium]|nr:tetratricopeptide repeat protein [bacterium]
MPIHAGNPAAKGIASLLGLALAAMEEGDVERAVASLDKCRRSVPANLTARCLSTRLMFAIGETEAAGRTLRQLVEAAADSKEVQLLAGEVGWIQRDHKLAREMWEIAAADTARGNLFVADASNLAVAWLIAADLTDGDIDAAASRLHSLVARDLQTAGCLLLASIVAKQDPQIDEAFPTARTIIHLRSWSDEISMANQPRLLAAYNSNVPQYAERFGGVEQLFIDNSAV